MEFSKYTTLKEFGYGFNEKGQLRQLEKDGTVSDRVFEFNVKPDDRMYNQKHYEALGEVINGEVYNLLEDKEKGGLVKTPILAEGEESCPEGSQRGFVFTSPGFEKAACLLVILHGAGVVRAGQWSRKLIINNDLDKGTQLPFIKWGNEHKLGVVVLNYNHNKGDDGKALKGSATHEEHARNAWKQLVTSSAAKKILMVAHSFGGVITMDLASKYPEDFLTRVERILLTDSVHHDLTPNKEVNTRLTEIAVNYVTSDQPLGTVISEKESRVRRLSAGHTVHEWTSWSAMEVILQEMEQCLGGAGEEGSQNGASVATASGDQDQEPPEVKKPKSEL